MAAAHGASARKVASRAPQTQASAAARLHRHLPRTVPAQDAELFVVVPTGTRTGSSRSRRWRRRTSHSCLGPSALTPRASASCAYRSDCAPHSTSHCCRPRGAPHRCARLGGGATGKSHSSPSSRCWRWRRRGSRGTTPHLRRSVLPHRRRRRSRACLPSALPRGFARLRRRLSQLLPAARLWRRPLGQCL